MKTSELQYDLPPALIAQQPCPRRDGSRLMVLHRRSGRIEHRTFRDLVSFLQPQDCLVLNKTRVLPARFVAQRATGGRIGGLFVRELGPGRWQVMLSGTRRLRPQQRLCLAGSAAFIALGRHLERGLWEVTVDPPAPAAELLGELGAMPLPPYVHRAHSHDEELDKLDKCRYQTVYAAVPGAIAAPTAGLHFTTALLDEIHRRGICLADVVLHVGLGTFQPIEVDDLRHHSMHSEWYELPTQTVQKVEQTHTAAGRVFAVGTTTVRVLETCARDGSLVAQDGWTDIFIYPPYTFRTTDALLTNFHLPGSTLLALVCAFAGREQVLSAYHAAVQERYRFYSYGDAMLIL